MLAASLMGAVEKAKRIPQNTFWRTILSQQKQDFAYVLGLIPHKIGSFEDYRKSRKDLLSYYCQIVAYRRRQLRTIFGIAINKDPSTDDSFDFVLFESPEEWSNEMEREIQELQTKLGLHLQSGLTMHQSHGNEYPEPTIHVPTIKRKIGRNEICPCGSGVKYKKCCGRK